MRSDRCPGRWSLGSPRREEKHAGAFLIINVFFWVLDAWGEGGVNWSFFITAAWGFALAFHALAYFIDGRQLEDRKIAEYLAEEKQREVSEN